MSTQDNNSTEVSVTQSGPTGTTGPQVPSGPTGEEIQIKKFAGYLIKILGICKGVIQNYLTSPDLIKIALNEMGLNSSKDVKEDLLITSFKKYEQSFAKSDMDQKKKYFLGSFNKLFSEYGTTIMLQMINDDSWIKKNNLQLMFGDIVGKETTI